MATWSELLRTARRQRGVRQRDLAMRASTSLRTVNGYERGAVQPSRDTLLKLTTALGMDRVTTNAVLTDAGFDPVPTGQLARFERRSLPFAAMQQEIDRYPWPCLVMSDDMTILFWNAPATWVAELDFATALPAPPDRTLMRVAASRHFRARVRNWDEVVSVMIAMLKADFEDPDRYAEVMPSFAKLVQDLSTQPEYHDAFPLLMQHWQRVAPREDVCRTSFRADWQLADGTLLAFNCLVSSWDDFDAAGAFDWFPADRATATWLQEQARQTGADVSRTPPPPDVAAANDEPIAAWNELLRSAREKTDLTQAQLATAIGVSEHAVFSYEKGRRRPSRAALVRLTRALHSDGATTNLLLTSVGHAPVASEIARTVAGLESRDPRFRPERWQALAERTAALLPDAIAAHPWPCVVFDERGRLRAANDAARRPFGPALDRDTVLELLLSETLRSHIANYNEVLRTLAPNDLRSVMTGSGNGPDGAPLRTVLDDLATRDPEGSARLRAVWAESPAPGMSTRAVVPVRWQNEDGTLLSFHGVLSLWSDVLWYWALDLHPVDAGTWGWFGS